MKYNIFKGDNVNSNRWVLIDEETFKSQLLAGDIIRLVDEEFRIIKVVLTPGDICGNIYVIPN